MPVSTAAPHALQHTPHPTLPQSAGSAATFNWCEGKTCYLTLEIGGDALHHDVGIGRIGGLIELDAAPEP